MKLTPWWNYSRETHVWHVSCLLFTNYKITLKRSTQEEIERCYRNNWNVDWKVLKWSKLKSQFLAFTWNASSRAKKRNLSQTENCARCVKGKVQNDRANANFASRLIATSNLTQAPGDRCDLSNLLHFLTTTLRYHQ